MEEAEEGRNWLCEICPGYGVYVEATGPLPQDIGTGNSMEETVFWEKCWELPGPVSRSRFRS